MQQEAEHQQQKIVGVEVGDREDRILARKLLREPAAAERDQQERQQGTIFKPLAGALARGQRRHFGR